MNNQTGRPAAPRQLSSSLSGLTADTLAILKTRLLWGLLGALAGALGGGLFGGRHGILNGLNTASLGLAMLAGVFVWGHGSVRSLDARHRHFSQAETPLPLTPYPWGSILSALFASACCGGVWWLAHLLLH